MSGGPVIYPLSFVRSESFIISTLIAHFWACETKKWRNMEYKVQLVTEMLNTQFLLSVTPWQNYTYKCIQHRRLISASSTCWELRCTWRAQGVNRVISIVFNKLCCMYKIVCMWPALLTHTHTHTHTHTSSLSTISLNSLLTLVTCNCAISPQRSTSEYDRNVLLQPAPILNQWLHFKVLYIIQWLCLGFVMWQSHGQLIVRGFPTLPINKSCHNSDC